MLRSADDAANAALRRFNEALEKAKSELREDTARLHAQHTALKELCEVNATMQAHIKDPKWDRRLEALQKEQFTIEQQNAQLRGQLDSNDQYMAQLRATRTAVDTAVQRTKDNTQSARETYIAKALTVHAAVMTQMAPAQSLTAWRSKKRDAQKALGEMETLVQTLRGRATTLRESLATLTDQTATKDEEEQAGSMTESSQPDAEAASKMKEEKRALLQTLAELNALCAQRTAEQHTQQQALITERDALRTTLSALCEEVEALDVREQACQQRLRQAVQEAAATTHAQDTRCRHCQADIFLSFS